MRRVVTDEEAARAIVDGVEVNGHRIAAQVVDGTVFIAGPGDFFVASFEIVGCVQLNRRTYRHPSEFPNFVIRLPTLDADA